MALRIVLPSSSVIQSGSSSRVSPYPHFTPLRKAIPCAYLAGAVAWVLVVGVTGCAAWGLTAGAGRLHPVAQDVMSVLLLYTAFAARDLAGHSHRVLRALRSGDLPEARILGDRQHVRVGVYTVDL